MPKQFIITAIFFLSPFCGISFSQNNICEYDDSAGDIFYRIYKNPKDLNKEDNHILKQIKQLITNNELENLYILKNDEGFRGNFKKGRNKCNIVTDFVWSSFESVYDMFKYCNSAVSEKYVLAKSQLDTFFIEKDLLNKFKINEIIFFYSDEELHGEINLYKYSYCDRDNYYMPANSMAISTNNTPAECNQNLISLREFKNYKYYVMPISYKSMCIYLEVHFIKTSAPPASNDK